MDEFAWALIEMQGAWLDWIPQQPNVQDLRSKKKLTTGHIRSWTQFCISARKISRNGTKDLGQEARTGARVSPLDVDKSVLDS